jgi:hypothetical protein
MPVQCTLKQKAFIMKHYGLPWEEVDIPNITEASTLISAKIKEWNELAEMQRKALEAFALLPQLHVELEKPPEDCDEG